jgi:hypothetical protein
LKLDREPRTRLSPKLGAYLVAALANLQRDYFTVAHA